MKNKRVRNWIILVITILLIILSACISYFCSINSNELRVIKSERELEKIYKGSSIEDVKESFIKILSMPFTFLAYWDRKSYNINEI